MSWMTKIAKFMNDRCAICGYCHGHIVATRIMQNPNHIYTIGQMYECNCGRSKIWTNSVRNDQSFLYFLRGESNPNMPWRSKDHYQEGFCNDKFCGHTLHDYIQVLKNGVSVPGFPTRLDLLGNANLPTNQGILMDFSSEYREGNVDAIIEWYRQRQSELESLMMESVA